jgi:protoheme IX farnesyltransferase
MSTRESRLKDTSIRLSEATAADFFALLKPRVMALAVFTAFVGLMVAPSVMNPVIAVVAKGGISIGARAAGAPKNWLDADNNPQI